MLPSGHIQWKEPGVLVQLLQIPVSHSSTSAHVPYRELYHNHTIYNCIPHFRFMHNYDSIGSAARVVKGYISTYTGSYLIDDIRTLPSKHWLPVHPTGHSQVLGATHTPGS